MMHGCNENPMFWKQWDQNHMSVRYAKQVWTGPNQDQPGAKIREVAG